MTDRATLHVTMTSAGALLCPVSRGAWWLVPQLRGVLARGLQGLDEHPTGEGLRQVLLRGNDQARDALGAVSGQREGCWVAAAQIDARQRVGHIASVGDVRVYLARGGDLRRLCGEGGSRSSRVALGTTTEAGVVQVSVPVGGGDALLLATRALCEAVGEERLGEALRQRQGAAHAARTIVEAAAKGEPRGALGAVVLAIVDGEHAGELCIDAHSSRLARAT